MVVLPISRLDNRIYNNNVNFGQIARHNEEEVQSHQPRKASKMVTIPLATLMALMPIANSNNNAVAQTRGTAQTELLAQNTSRRTTKYPFDHRYFLANNDVVHTERFKAAGKMQTLVFTHNSSSRSGFKDNDVERIYMIPDGYKTNSSKTPAQVTKLVYHNIGKDKEYCGIIVHEDIYDGETSNGVLGEYKGTLVNEYRLPDEVANTIIRMMSGNSNLNNKTPIKFVETTSAKRQYPYMSNKYTGETW